jgi:hypothetical protein
MSITYGDNLKHNNPLFPIVDVEDVKGGARTIATFSNTDLYNAFNDIPDKLKQNYTSLIVTSTSQHYYLTGIDATITTSWTLTGSGLSGTGTTNSIAKWSGSTSLGDSLISDNGDTITISGNLNVIGTSSTITSENLLVKDPIILLAGSQSTPLFDSGLFINRGTGDTQAFIWDESASEFSFLSTTSSSSTLGNVSIGTYSSVRTGPLSIGTGTASDSRFLVSSSTGSVSLIVGENGSVSIGGALTSFPLKVYGSAEVTGFFYTNVTQVSTAIIFDGAGNTGIKRNNLGLEFFNFATSSSAIRFTNNNYVTNTGETTMLVDVDKKYVGIGTASPSTKLHVYATQSGAFRLQDGTQQDNYILKSDSNGVASWVSLSTIGISGTSGSIPKFTGTSSLGNSRFKDNGTTGSYEISAGNGVYFLSGANTYLTLDRGQSEMSFYLGNPGITQSSRIISTNTYRLDIESVGYTIFKTGSSYSLTIDSNGVYNQIKGITNTIYGYQTLQNNTTGLYNVAIGFQVLQNNTTGTNTGIGYETLNKSTTAVSSLNIINSGSGYTASSTFSNITLSYISGSTALTYPIVDVYIGSTGSVSTITLVTNGTGFKDTTTIMGANLGTGVTFSVTPGALLIGDQNNAIGFQTLKENTTGFRNTALGDAALRENTTGYYNTALGSNSLLGNTTGNRNTALGWQSLANNTTGNRNMALGYQVLFSNTTGFNNTALGYDTLYSNTTGFGNTSLGYEALYTATSSNYSTAVGYQALYSNTTASGNQAIGYQVLFSNTTGTMNTALGYQSLYYNTTGQRNIAIGEATMASNKSGEYNTAVGAGVLNQATASSYNTAFGSKALQTLEVGNYNTALGRDSALYSTTNILGSPISLTQSSNSVYIGADIRPIENQTNQIIIGYGATGSGSNTVTLGADTITKTQLRGTINIGNVPQYASNGAAISAGLVPGDIYQTLSNVLMVVI